LKNALPVMSTINFGTLLPLAARVDCAKFIAKEVPVSVLVLNTFKKNHPKKKSFLPHNSCKSL
jgi:hypothetical protein